jgi:AcrR family transcriptional regulator
MLPPGSAPAAPDASITDRPLRADALRNRGRVLEAAEAVFAAKGASASTEEIARRAGVGIGTLFRHFPTKEALIGAIVIARVRRLADAADAFAASPDPAAAFAAFFGYMAEEMAAKRAFTNLLADGFVDVRAANPGVVERLLRAIEVLLARAQRVGAVRDDVGLAEVTALLAGASRAAEYAGEDRALRSRAVAIVLDGLAVRRTADAGQ